MLTYHDSSWAVRRWDWVNSGMAVRPKSFCQFWRAVLFHATIKWALMPLFLLGKVASLVPLPTLPMPRLVGNALSLPGKGLWLSLQLTARAVWFAIYPLRLAARCAGGAALSGAVAVGDPAQRFYEHHREGIDTAAEVAIVLGFIAYVIFVAAILLLAVGYWALVGAGAGAVVLLAIYGFIKSGAPGLLWQAAVAAHHGICPPVEIIRGE